MINVIAIDDEPLALQQLATYINKVPFLNLCAQCGSAAEAKEALERDRIDAMFCDINMPDLNGMDFVRNLAAPPIVVFTTAYSEYAVEGYKVDAVDYLLKPFSLDEFRRAANKVKRQYELLNAAPVEPKQEQVSDMSIDSDAIFLKTDHRVLRIQISDIRYIEGMSEYLKFHVDTQPRPVIALLSMKKIESRLPDYFMRIHRSFIINLRKIVEVNKSRVLMGDNIYLPIGDLYRDSFMNYIESKFLGK